MTDSRSIRVVLGNVLAESFITEHAEELAVRDAAEGLWTFTSKPDDVPFTGVDLFLTPHPRNSFQANARPSDNSVRTEAKTTCKE